MLRLLAQREQGYEDIGALMGLSVDEVRVKVREALGQLEEADRPVEEAPKAAEPAKVEKPVPPPKESAPERAVDKAPVEPTKPPAPPTAPAEPPSSPLSRVSLPTERRRLAAVAAGAGVVVLLIVLLATGAFSSSGGSSKSVSNTGSTAAATTAATGSKQLTRAILTPVNGGSARGQAVFGRVRKTAVLEVVAKGLDPSPAGQSYTVWLYRSPKVVLRVGGVHVGKSGGIAAQFPIPTQLLAYVASGAFDQIDISLTPDAAYKAEVAQAKKQKRLPSYTGTDILRGRITGPAIKSTSGN